MQNDIKQDGTVSTYIFFVLDIPYCLGNTQLGLLGSIF